MSKSRHIYAPRGESFSTLKLLIRVETDDCVLWPHAKRSNGYGALSLGNNKIYSTHVVAWALANGKRIPRKKRAGNTKKGLIVCHTCDVRSCINPRHLFRGTIKNNLDDMDRKGRRPIGERHPRAKLTEKAIRQIRLSNDSLKDLGARYGVDKSVVCNIRQRKSWRHVS